MSSRKPNKALFSLIGMEEKPSSSEIKKKKQLSHIPMIWRDEVRLNQNNKCVGKNCAKLHYSKRKVVNNRSSFDHIRPVELGGKTLISNLVALCPKCHWLKLKEDRHNMAQAKKQEK